MVRHYAAHYNVPQELISALIDVESAWNPRAVSEISKRMMAKK
jgi:soluble lytic murein transglycosylase-like protein